MTRARFQVNSSFAQEIVDAAKEVIRKDINFIQLNGKIIASTDPLRIGSFHEAALQVIEKGNVVFVTDNNELKGTRKGINYPILIDRQLLGVIGISGEPDECETLGFLLTKITELLIREQMIASRDHSLEQIRSSIVRMIIFENKINDNSFIELLQQLQYELEQKVFVSIIYLHGINHHSYLYFDVQKILLNQGITLLTYLFPNQYVAIINQSQYKDMMGLWNSPHAIPIPFSIGVGNLCFLEDVSASFQNAKIALKYAQIKESRLCQYAELDIEMIIENIDKNVGSDYIFKLIGELSEEDITLLQTYYKENFSLYNTAKALFIHKNTIQYRLNKIADKTKLDPRNYHDSVKLYIALLLRTKN